MGCPNDVVPGYASWNGGNGNCGRTSKKTSMKLESFNCTLKYNVGPYTRSICQKPKEGKISLSYVTKDEIDTYIENSNYESSN